MAQVLTSISGIQISAASAGHAPTISADVSAIASAYQVVSATGTQLYAGTAHVTSINGDPISASRAGNAANASLATSAWYDGTGRLISALPDEATVSSIASAYADDKLDKTAQVVTATAGDGTYVTSINGMGISGQGGGGGATGDYVETSATEVAIGSDNTASSTSFAQGYRNSASYYSFAQGSGNRASNYSIAQGKQNTASDSTFAQGENNWAASDSFAQGYRNTASFRSFAQGYRNSASSLSFAQGLGITAKNSVAVFGLYNLHGDGDTATGNSAAFAIGDGTASGARHDLMVITKDGEITMYSSTADTTGTGIMSAIRAISAAATSGVDSATVSAIASAYQVVSSTASGSGEIFGQTAYYATEINGLTLSAQEAALANYATNAGSAGAAPTNSSDVSAIASGYASGKADSSALSSYALSADVSSTIDTVSSNSASWTTDLTDYATTAYVDSSVSSKADSSSLSSYALSADVSSTVDVVSTQSANWGGSALALSAGPGVTLTKSGNTLIAGLDETVLWSGANTNITGITLNETYGNFDRVRFYWKPWSDAVAWRVTEIPSFAMVFTLDAGWASNAGSGAGKALFVYSISSNGTAFSQIQGGYQNITGSTAWASSTNCTVAKVVGINRTAGV